MSNLAILGGKPVGTLNVPQWPIFDEREVEMVSQVVKSGNWGFLGPKEKEFEKKFAKFCGTKFGIAVANGTVSLKIALEALGVGPGDEVIVPGLTWQATASAVLDVNAVPILVDVDPNTYTISPKEIEAAITPRTKCIIPVHLYGRVADMNAIMELAEKYNLYVIEDCAHQHGSQWKGKPVGSIGDIGSFSFQSSKIITSGEGGILTTNNQQISDLLQSLKICGRNIRKGAHAMHSGNYRMTEFQAAILIVQLMRLDEQNIIRDKNAMYLEEMISDIEGLSSLYRSPDISRQSYYYLTIKYNKEEWEGVPKEVFMRALSLELNNSVICSQIYEPLNASPFYKPLNKKTHKLNKEYQDSIDPRRFDLPVCKRAFEDEAINFYHTTLLADRVNMDKLIYAMYKLRNNIGELVKYHKYCRK